MDLRQRIDTFFTQYKRQVYKKRELLIRADDDPSGIFYLTKGRVKMFAISQKGEEVILTIFKPGSFFPMFWALNDSPNHYYFEAMEEVEVWKAPKGDVISFLKESPDVLYDLLQRLYRGLDGVLIRMVHLMGGSAYIRLVHEIVINAKRFGKESEENFVTIEISEIELAKQTGLTRETISREIKILKEKGLIDFSKNTLVIPDLNRFYKELEQF